MQESQHNWQIWHHKDDDTARFEVIEAPDGYLIRLPGAVTRHYWFKEDLEDMYVKLENEDTDNG